MVHKRDWPAGEPRLHWLNKTTAEVLLRNRWIVARSSGDINPVIDLTNGGRAAMLDG